MRDYKNFLEQVERVIHKYNQRESKKQNYGLDFPLTQTEIHLIAVIGERPGIGIKALAELKGVTAGAASQMIKKLVKKGLVHKQISVEIETMVELTLTEKGQICFAEHQKFHEEANKKWYALLDEIDDGSYETLSHLLTKMEEMLTV